MNKIKEWLSKSKNTLLLWFSLLITIGAVAIYSVGAFNAYLPFMITGIVLFIICCYLPKKWLIRVSIVWGCIGIGLILKTLIAPEYIAGATRYTHVFGISIDPYMLFLPAYTVLMALFFEKHKTWLNLLCALITLFVLLNAMHAPYISMAMVYLVLFIALFLTNTTRKKLYTGLLLAVVIFMVGSIALLPHVQTRLLSVFYANTDTVLWYVRNMIMNSDFVGANPIAESYLSKIPSAPTYYMLYAIEAKFGLFAICAVLFAEYKLISNILHNNKDNFSKTLTIGTAILLIIGVVMQLLTAVMAGTNWYLPFVSLGGISLLAYCALVGITYRVCADYEKL